MKLWQKDYRLFKEIEEYTVGDDYLLDKKLIFYDCMASIAHAKMLTKIKILNRQECIVLVNVLNEIIDLDSKNKFLIQLEDEDCHTAIENYLTKKCGVVGEKIHTARSRNDQVLTALRLYEKAELNKIKKLLTVFRNFLKQCAEQYSNILFPGYTHMQKAMPTSFKEWFLSFYFALEDDIFLLESVLKLIDKSPLGRGAGFGIPVIKLDKEYTSKLLGFSKVFESAMHIHSSRGKFESSIIHFLSQIMFDLNKFAADIILFNMSEFGFLNLDKKLCTGSSIMPQKKNPDVLEIMRANYHVLCGNEITIKGIIGNLISGYHRDLQLIKKPIIESVEITKKSLEAAILVVENLYINKENCKRALTKEIYATENAYKLVKNGVSFRTAYKKIAKTF